MAHVIVLGAGLGGTIMAYELREALGRELVCINFLFNTGSADSAKEPLAVQWRKQGAEFLKGPQSVERHRVELFKDVIAR